MVNDPFLYGQIAAANSLSDVYAMGGKPLTGLNLLGYPDDKDPELTWLEKMFQGGIDRFQKAGAVIVGGHTVRDSEIKFGYAVSGIVHPQKILTNAAARPGDQLILTKPLGTGFATTAHKAGACSEELFNAAVASMTMLNDVGRDAMVAAGAHSATDITGFGLAGHAYGMAEGSKTTLIIHLSRLPLLPGAEAFARKPYLTRASGTNAAYVAEGLAKEGNLNPIRLEFFYDAQTSGGLLAAVPEVVAGEVTRALASAGTLASATVGRITGTGSGKIRVTAHCVS